MPMPNVDQTAAIELLVMPNGMLFSPDDYSTTAVAGSIGMASFVENNIGRILSALGISNALPVVNPVSISLTGALGFQVAGHGQWMIAQGRQLDQCPLYSPSALAPADIAQPRIDVLAVMATRVQGSSSLVRTVRALGATPQYDPLGGVLVAGVATVTLPAGYTSAPAVESIEPLGAGGSGGIPTAVSVSTTQIAVSSLKDDGSVDTTDARAFNVLLYGNPTGSTGVPTTQTLYENQPAWAVVTGTPSATPVAPPTPAGYEAFATFLIPANATTIAPGNVTVLFPTVIQVTGGATLAQNGSAILSGGLIHKWGEQDSVLADGTSNEVLVTFPVAFPNTAFQVVPGIYCGAADPGNQLSVRLDSKSRNGFRATVSGGAPGLAVTVSYMADGY